MFAAFQPPFCVKPPMQAAPLVGSQAPDFTATAVFDQEFVDTTLSQYRVRGASWHVLLGLYGS